MGFRRYLYLTDERIDIEDRGGMTTLLRKQIAAIDVAGGKLEIHEHGAQQGLIRDRGIHRLPIAEIDNYTLLLESLEQELGLRLRKAPRRGL